MFVQQVIATLDAFNWENLHLPNTYSRLKARLHDVNKIKIQVAGSADTEPLREMDVQRDDIFIGISASVRNFMRMNFGQYALFATLLNRLLEKYGRNLTTDNYNSETMRIKEMMAEYTATPEYQEAAQALNLVPMFSQLHEVNTSFATKFMARTAKEATVADVDIRSIRLATDKALSEMLKAMEAFSGEYNELDYTTPAAALNELLDYYRNLLKTREGRREAEKESKKPAGEGEDGK
jgi:hypothetical protein